SGPNSGPAAPEMPPKETCKVWRPDAGLLIPELASISQAELPAHAHRDSAPLPDAADPSAIPALGLLSVVFSNIRHTHPAHLPEANSAPTAQNRHTESSTPAAAIPLHGYRFHRGAQALPQGCQRTSHHPQCGA